MLRRRHPRLKLHSDLNTLDLTQEVPAGVFLDIVVITTPCVDVSARGQGQAQKGEVRPHKVNSRVCALEGACTECGRVQESPLFFVAVKKVQDYAAWSGSLPTIISENVQGRRFRRWDDALVRGVTHSNMVHDV